MLTLCLIKNKILKLKDSLKLETTKLRFNFDRCKLPNSFTKLVILNLFFVAAHIEKDKFSKIDVQ